MPSITTHRLFGLDVLNKLPNNIKENIDKDIYTVFCQSFDNFFYYNLISFKKGKSIREFGRYCHKNKTQEYFINIIKYIKDNNLENNSDCLSYLYGSITHLVLDSTMHPYVFYKTGVFKKNDITSYKYNGLHTKLEAMLDKYFYELKFNKQYNSYPHYKYNFPKINFSCELKNIVNHSFKTTFNKNNMANIYYKSYNQGRFIFKYGVFDKYGVKRKLYQLIDILRPQKYKKNLYVSSYIKEININYLNHCKSSWYCSATENYINFSVDELYNVAISKAIKIIKKLDKLLQIEDNIIKYRNLIPDISYISGKNIKDKYKMHIFEF